MYNIRRRWVHLPRKKHLPEEGFLYSASFFLYVIFLLKHFMEEKWGILDELECFISPILCNVFYLKLADEFN